MRKRTPWTAEERDGFVAWHEDVLRQYPADVARELRRYRVKLLESVKVIGGAGE